MAVGDQVESAETTIDLIIIVAIITAVGVVGYLLYKMIACTLDSSKCNADNGQPRCSFSDLGGNCVGSDGSACSWWEFFTATSCYKGTPQVPTSNPDNTDSGSVVSGAYDYVTGAGNDVPPSASAPGLPEGYDPNTGEILE